MKIKEELEAADKAAAEKLQTAHIAWARGTGEEKASLWQAREAAHGKMMAIRREMAALPLTGDALLRHEQGLEANRAQLAASRALLEKDKRTAGILKTQAQLDSDYDKKLSRENE
jgi:hypothetical protein